MNLQIKLFKKKILGFSLVEIIIVIGIIGILSTISVSVYTNFKNHENLEIATISVVEAIRYARANAQSGKNDIDWGVKILSNSVVVFKGTSYFDRDNSADQSVEFYGGVTASGLSEIVFTKIFGSTLNVGTVTLTNSYGIKNILINEKGTITY